MGLFHSCWLLFTRIRGVASILFAFLSKNGKEEEEEEEEEMGEEVEKEEKFYLGWFFLTMHKD